MPLPSTELFVQPQPLRLSSNAQSWPCMRTIVECSDPQAISFKFYCQHFPLKSLPMRFKVSSCATSLHLLGAVSLHAEAEDPSNAKTSSELDINPNSHNVESRGDVGGLSCLHSEPAVTCSMEDIKESERRRRIGLANKGKVPWNKGKKHSPETRARIREKTLEALQDPKVRRKMSIAIRSHSEKSKEKISSSLKQLWARRLERKRSTEKFYLSWAENIAEAARRGGIDQEELSWNSFQVLKEEIASRQLQLAAEKAKKKEMKKIKAEKRAREKAKKMVSQARKKKMDHKQKAGPRTKQKGRLTLGRKQKKEEQAICTESDSKAKLKKINGKKAIDGTFCGQAGVMLYLQTALDRLDIESIKKEQGRTTVSLADQIQAAKRKRMEAMASGSAIGATSSAS